MLIKWTFKGRSIPSNAVQCNESNHYVLKINNVKEKNEGSYTCHGKLNSSKNIIKFTEARGKLLIVSK